MYKIGVSLVKIPKKIIDRILKWAEFPMNTSAFIDRLFVQALLVACAGSERIIRREISNETKQFIMGMHIKYILNDLVSKW